MESEVAALEMRTKLLHPEFMAFIRYLWPHPLKSDSKATKVALPEGSTSRAETTTYAKKEYIR